MTCTRLGGMPKCSAGKLRTSSTNAPLGAELWSAFLRLSLRKAEVLIGGHGAEAIFARPRHVPIRGEVVGLGNLQAIPTIAIEPT